MRWDGKLTNLLRLLFLAIIIFLIIAIYNINQLRYQMYLVNQFNFKNISTCYLEPPTQTDERINLETTCSIPDEQKTSPKMNEGIWFSIQPDDSPLELEKEDELVDRDDDFIVEGFGEESIRNEDKDSLDDNEQLDEPEIKSGQINFDVRDFYQELNEDEHLFFMNGSIINQYDQLQDYETFLEIVNDEKTSTSYGYQFKKIGSTPFYTYQEGFTHNNIAYSLETRITLEDAVTNVIYDSLLPLIILLFLFGTSFIIIVKRFSKKEQLQMDALVNKFKQFVDLDLKQIQAYNFNDSADSASKEKQILNYFSKFCENNYVNYENIKKHLTSKLDAANEESHSKSIYLANMSHEMRTPLNSIIGYSQLIEMHGFEDIYRIKEYFSRINNSSDILLQKINDILDLAKIEANQFELFPKSTEIKKVIKEVYELLVVEANKKGITFEYTIDPLIPRCLNIDDSRFKQILINLCSNSIKFTTEGYVRLDIEMFGHINDAIVLDYKVSDTGCGIPSDQLENDKIFTPFVQANNGQTNGMGTGLGLAIARDLIRLMNGDVHVTSKVGVGTIFSFTTIFDTCSCPLPLEETDNNHSDDSINSVIKDKKILVVEDNHINQVLIKEVFNVFDGKEIDIANDGLEAIELCQDKQYDIVFMDIQMPNCDGVEATKMIRKMDSYKWIPIIALTANAFSEQVNEYLTVGMNDYLKKPFDFLNFKEILVKYLS